MTCTKIQKPLSCDNSLKSPQCYPLDLYLYVKLVKHVSLYLDTTLEGISGFSQTKNE